MVNKRGYEVAFYFAWINPLCPKFLYEDIKCARKFFFVREANYKIKHQTFVYSRKHTTCNMAQNLHHHSRHKLDEDKRGSHNSKPEYNSCSLTKTDFDVELVELLKSVPTFVDFRTGPPSTVVHRPIPQRCDTTNMNFPRIQSNGYTRHLSRLCLE